MQHRLVIQLARLGDLLQSWPAIAALQARFSEDVIDLLCAAPLVNLGNCFPGPGKAFPWNGDLWGKAAKSWGSDGQNTLVQAADCLKLSQFHSYPMAYNLNNHPRAVFAAHLLADNVVGAGCHGPLSHHAPNWVNYLKAVAAHRGRNRVHLADAFCGVCGVHPPLTLPRLQKTGKPWPHGLGEFAEARGVRVAVVLGSGDADRRIPLQVWEKWVNLFLSICPEGQVMLVGGAGERELTFSLLDRISSMNQCRIWNACGRTTLPELADVLSHCHWVIGSDTGPLHLGVTCGAKAQGFYFSHARVHETGPYGVGHWVWQANDTSSQDVTCKLQNNREGVRPDHWPVRESVELLLDETPVEIPRGWSLWKSQYDEWGAHYSQYGSEASPHQQRKDVWETLQGSVEIDSHRLQDLLHVQKHTVTIQGM